MVGHDTYFSLPDFKVAEEGVQQISGWIGLLSRPRLELTPERLQVPGRVIYSGPVRRWAAP
ncbi:hypothetical protein J6590_100295, partial [Homalodisca vitripennis]